MREIYAIEGMEPHREGEYAMFYKVDFPMHGNYWVRKIEGRICNVTRAYWYDV